MNEYDNGDNEQYDEVKYNILDRIGQYRVEDVKQYGIGGAVTLYYLISWMVWNKHSKRWQNKSLQQGRYWVFRSRQKMVRDIGLSEDALRRHINKFIEDGLLLIGNFNPVNYDNTLWYTVNDPEIFNKWENLLLQRWRRKKVDPPRKMPPTPPQDAGTYTNKNPNNKNVISKDITKTQSPIASATLFDNLVKGKQIAEIVDYWNSLTVVKKLRLDKTKTFDRAVALIGKALKKYNADEILTAMYRYKHIKTMQGTRLTPEYKIPLPSFFECQNEHERIYLERLNIKSWFEECLTDDKDDLRRKFSRLRKEYYPEVAGAIKRAWLQGPYYRGEITAVEENHFRLASEMIIDWLEKNKAKYYFREFEDEYPEKFAFRYLVKCIEYTKPNIPVSTAWLITEKTYAERLHNYLISQGKGA